MACAVDLLVCVVLGVLCTVPGGLGQSVSCTFEDGMCGWTQATDDDGEWFRRTFPAPLSFTGPLRDRSGRVGQWALRLSGGSTMSEGRVEVSLDDQWVTVCDYSWDLNDANVVCRQLGYGAATAAPRNAAYGPGQGNRQLYRFRCSGSESYLSQCSRNGPGHYCSSYNDAAGVQCSGTSGTSPSAYYCYSYGGNYAGNKARLVSPEVRLSGTHGAWRLTFWYNMYGSYIGRLNVYTATINGTLSGSSAIFSRYSQQNDYAEWSEAEVFISDVASPGFRIVLEVVRHSGSSGYNYRGDIAVDDIDLREYNNLAPLGFSCTFQDGFCGWTQSSRDYADWRRNRGSTPTSSTGPNVDRTIGDSSGYYSYVRARDLGNRQNAALLSPRIVRHGQNRDWCFTFWYNMYGQYMGTLNVYRIPIGGELSDGEIIFSRSGQQAGPTIWLQADIHLTDAPSGFQIAIQAVRLYSNYYSYRAGDIAIDDIKHNAPCADCHFEQDTCGWTQSADDDAQWTRNRGPTESDDTGPEFDKTTGDSSGYYCYFEASSPRSHEDTAVLRSGVFPPAPDHPGLTWYIRFWYNMHGSDIGTLNVYRMPSNGTTADGEVLFSRTGEQSNGTVWLPAVVNVTHAASGFKIAFEAVRGLDYLGDIALDDVSTSSVVMATRILLFDSSLNYSTGDVVHLVKGRRRHFSCAVPDIDPGASIKLMVGDQEISGVTSHRLEGDAVLTTSTVTFDMLPTQAEHGEFLECRANNVEGHSGVSVNVRLYVKVPPQVSSISLYDDSGTMLGPTADTVHRIPHTFTCNVTDTRPAVTIEWYLNNTLKHTSSPPTGDALVNTTSTWTFQPIWSSHVEVVRCVARTAESLEPFPSVNVTVTVYAYPLSIRLSDSSGTYTPANGTSHLVEGVEHQFTCEVPDIDPGASITWSVGGQLHRAADNNDHVRGDNGLTTTTSVVALVPTTAMQGQMLECHASNADDHPGITASVQLYIKVPPKASSMSLYDSSGARLTSTADVYQGVQQAFTCTVRDTSPAATIRWYLADVLQDTVAPAAGAGQEGFVNTSDTWTLIPTRDDNGKGVSCVASTAESLQPFPFVSVTLHVNVLSSSIILSDPTGNYPSANGTSHLVEGVARNFTCMVPGVDPGASFNWTLGSRELIPVYSSNITRMDGLINSTSVVTVWAKGRDHGEILRCRASIKAGHPGISTGVMLDVKVPPKESSMSLHITNGTRLYDVVEVVQDTPRTLTCRIAGTRPAPTVQWFLDDVRHSVRSPPPGVDEGLVDTAVEWTFTPSRVNQGQEVKCVAYTAESNQPYPSVVVTLDVIVLPVTITMSDSSQSYTSAGADIAYLLDGESHQFTCEVPEIHPGASFIWTLGGREITGEVNTHVPLADGLTTSRSVATIIATNRYHGEILMCRASNRDGDRGVAVSVTLYIKVPPVESRMSLFDLEGDTLQTTAVVDEDIMHPFTCEVLNTRPATTIQWYINGVLHRTTPPTATADRLVNSTDTWAFVPRKADHHLQELTCVAYTAASQQPYPSVSVTLDVKVSPTRVIISDSNGTYPVTGGAAYLLEGAIHPFTCEAWDIDPGANFTWTLGGQWIAPVNGSNVVGSGGWTNSSSVVSLAGTESNHGKILMCMARNRDDRPGATANVTLYVQVPPMASRMSLYDLKGDRLQTTAVIDEGTVHPFTCEVLNTRPAATIQWYINGVLNRTTPPTATGDRLVNSTDTWAFVPRKADHHLQVLTCVAYTGASQQPYPSVSVTLDVKVSPTSLTIFDSNGTYPASGGTAYLLEGAFHPFTCEARDIDPAANFTWTLGGQWIAPVNGSNVVGPGGWTNSSSVVSLAGTESNHGKVLMCLAKNRDDRPGATANVTLYVQVPPKATSMHLYDSTGTSLQATKDVDLGDEVTLTCEVRGTRPAAKIEWILRDALQSSISPASAGETASLVNSTGSWTFTAGRADHRQVVSCRASTADSRRPFPSVNVTLNVNGPPDTPVVTGSTDMTEGVQANLTCRADQGYPADWALLWSVRDSPVEPGPRTAPSASPGGRFTFTSTLEFSPRREDNGNTIQCSAHKDPWSPVSGSAFGPINVQFCSRMVSLTGCPRRVVAGGAASLRCVSGTSNPASTLRWTKGEANLTSQVRPTLADGDLGGQVTTANLTASPLDRTDHGAVIKCCAFGPAACQADVCDTCLLNVEYKPIFTEPTMTTPGPVTEGDDVVLSCTADANPKPPDFITWERVGSTDPLPSVYSNGASTLTLRSITRDQVGPYRCRGNNGVPPVTYSNQIRVAIHYEVTITNKASGSNHIRASNGERAAMVCEAKGNPLPLMTWSGPRSTQITNQTDPGRVSKVDTIISGDGVDGFTVRSVLYFNRVSAAEDYGFYTCNSGNGIGMVDTLIIQLSDKVVSTAPPTEAAASTSLPDRASVGSTIPATVKLTTRATTVPQHAASTTGHVMARPPAPPGHVFIDHDRSTATSLTVKWSPGNDGGSAQWFYVNYREVRAAASFDPANRSGRLTGGITEYTLSGLRPYTAYEVELYAENAYGSSAVMTKAGTTRQMSTEASVCKSCTDQTSPSSRVGIIEASTPSPSDNVSGVSSTAGASQAVAGSPNTVMIVVIAVLAVVALVSVALAVWFYRKRRLHKPVIDLPPLFYNRADRLQDEGSVATQIVEFGELDLPMDIVGMETKDDSA